MPPSPVVVDVPTSVAPRPSASFAGAESEAHAGDRDRDLQLERPLREARPEGHVRVAALAVALERVARDARTEEEQVVEVGYPALGAEAADVVDPLARGALDLGDHRPVEEVRLAEVPGMVAVAGHQ
jgi:hypothetical protein